MYTPPMPYNEPVLNYLPGSPEKQAIKKAIAQAKNRIMDIPMHIGGEKVFSGKKIAISCPHDHQHVLAHFHQGEKKHVVQAIDAALKAKGAWEDTPFEDKCAIFLKTADLIAGPYRAKINAATMLGQSKNVYQAEIDSACEMIDFLRFNVHFARDIYSIQPQSSNGMWNRLDYRPLEGFIYALTPFNFTAIAGNLPTAPALMGNTIVWKPAFTQIYSANVLMEVFQEAGLPDGVVNMVFTEGVEAGEIVFGHPEFAGLHFTGSTAVFQQLWRTIAANISTYRSYPRIVGETGGKDFILAHSSTNLEQLNTAIIRGAFEYQGQKCSAASRAYIPSDIWKDLKPLLLETVKGLKMGTVEDFTNFVNAVIDEKSFDKITAYIEEAKKSPDVEVIAGGNYDKSKGYFIEPTILLAKDPQYKTMCEEIFGPVITIYVFEPEEFDYVTEVLEKTSPYGLTGAIFCKDRYLIQKLSKKLRHAAGNFYINDKPTGAVVGQQPFGGGRASGTNDKAGAVFNLLRWTSPRTIKENFNPPVEYTYPFMKES